MTRAEVLTALRDRKAALARRFGVVEIGLFGSFARDEADADSDIDLLVRFDGPATAKRYFGAQFYIEDLLGRPVDLVTDKALRAEFRPHVEREATVSDKGGIVREWRCHIHDMIGFCEKVGAWTRGLDRDAFIANDMLRDATLRNLELVGEAATRIPDAIRNAHPEIPWRAFVDMRDRLARSYPGLDGDAVRSIVRNDIPSLPPALRSLLAAHEPPPPP